jgi:hypothetical protein
MSTSISTSLTWLQQHSQKRNNSSPNTLPVHLFDIPQHVNGAAKQHRPGHHLPGHSHAARSGTSGTRPARMLDTQFKSQGFDDGALAGWSGIAARRGGK